MKKMSYQLYSSRNHPPLESTCSMLAGLGYAEVEGYGGVYGEPGATRAALDASGLRMTSGHFGLEQLEEDPDGCFSIARQLGMESIYAPYLMPDQRPDDAQGYREIGARLAAARAKCTDAGFAFGWHNHDFELRPLPDGSLPLDLLLDADERIEWEADLAWIVVGGGDVDACVRRHAARISSVHIKDIAPQGECADEDGWADIGHGTLDWDALLAGLSGSPLRHYVLEHDKPSDDRRFAERSMEALLGFASLKGE